MLRYTSHGDWAGTQVSGPRVQTGGRKRFDAVPRSLDVQGDNGLTVEEIIAARGITEVLHFTTSLGLVGVLDSRAVKPTARLPEEKRLEFIFKPNAAFRKDVEWLGHVSLSLSRINSQFFATSRRWHRDLDIWWCILSFRPEILTHDGVVFTTTNNKYHVAIRQEGPTGLEQLFVRVVTEYESGTIARRYANMPPNFTTCEQAEVLYPGDLSTDYMQRIYVGEGTHQDEVCGQFSAVRHPIVEVAVEPDKFKPVRY